MFYLVRPILHYVGVGTFYPSPCRKAPQGEGVIKDSVLALKFKAFFTNIF
jgi:hypothetical protein